MLPTPHHKPPLCVLTTPPPCIPTTLLFPHRQRLPAVTVSLSPHLQRRRIVMMLQWPVLVMLPLPRPVHLAIQGSAPTSSNISSSTTSSPSSMTLTADGSSGSRSPSLPSSQGSASHLASIIGALDELALDSPVPHYVVVRGISPGVYTTWCASTTHF